jgi:hypothetical protein
VTKEQRDDIRARLDAADTDFRPDIDHVEEEFGFIGGVRVVTRALLYDSGIGTEQDKDDKAHAFCDLMSHAKTDLRALLDEVERLKEQAKGLAAHATGQCRIIEAQRVEMAELGSDVIRLTVERDAAFRRGAEAMREAAAKHFEERALQQRVAGDSIMAPVHEASAQRVRALPIPDAKP